MKKSIYTKKGIYLFLLLAFLAGGCRKEQGKKEQAQKAAPVPEILVNTPEEENVTYTYEYPAYLEAEQTVNLVARVSGFLEKILRDFCLQRG